MDLPKKRNYRQHAHSNPYTDHIKYPNSPVEINWCEIFNKLPTNKSSINPDMLDLGCGYGSFLLFLSKKYPDKNIIGMEIRRKVYKYVYQKIKYLQSQNTLNNNVGVVQANALLFYLNYFKKAQLEKIFCLFPDPQFKKRKQKVRIVCKQMLDQMAYTLKVGGRIYVSTDVCDLFKSMIHSLDDHQLFKKVDDDKDELFEFIKSETDESRRAGSKAGKIYAAIYERI
ncbi:tRNA (guanine-N(7)-)-methyltransferase [Dictyocoela muelleri]|nr:tRNA (guanine-N(7)-)-methyltransferase [Dictyocoela muelleri]